MSTLSYQRSFISMSVHFSKAFFLLELLVYWSCWCWCCCCCFGVAGVVTGAGTATAVESNGTKTRKAIICIRMKVFTTITTKTTF